MASRTSRKVLARQASALGAADDLGLSAAARRRLSAAQAMQVFSHRIGRELAAVIPGLTEDEIHDWGNASRERRGYHWKLVELVERAMDEGVDRKRALVLVDWIEAELGRVAFDLPRADRPFDARDLRRGIREAGEALAALVPQVSDTGDVEDAGEALEQLRELRSFCDDAIARLAYRMRSSRGRR